MKTFVVISIGVVLGISITLFINYQGADKPAYKYEDLSTTGCGQAMQEGDTRKERMAILHTCLREEAAR